MRYKKLAMLSLSAILAFMVMINGAEALEKGGYTFELVRDPSDLPNVIIEHLQEQRYYTPKGLIEFHMPILFKKNTVGQKCFTLAELSYRYGEKINIDQLDKVYVDYVKNETYWKNGEYICDLHDVNNTYCIDGHYNLIQDWRLVWRRVPSSVCVNPSRWYMIDIVANQRPTTEKWAIDVIPKFASIELDDYAWFSNNFTRAKNITIDNSGNARTLTNFPIRLNVTFDSDMEVDFGDVRFVNDSVDGAANAIELDYFWVERINSTYGIVDVEVDIIQGSTNRNISMYYDYNGAVTTQNGTDTYLFFDHFNGGSFDTNLWSVAAGAPSVSNSVVECDGQTSFTSIWNYQYNVSVGGNCSFETNAGGFWTGWGFNKDQDTERAMFFMPNGNNYSDTRTSGSETNTQLSDYTTTIGTKTWRFYEIVKPLDDAWIEFYIDYVLESNHTANIPTASDGGVSMINHPAGDSGVSMFCDWVYVANRTTPMPSYSFGAEQSGGVVSWINYLNDNDNVPATYNPSISSGFETEWNSTDSNGYNVSLFYSNHTGAWVAYPTSRTGNYSYYNQTIGATTFSWYMWANNSNNDANFTANHTNTIAQNSSMACFQTFVESSPITYEDTLTARCSCTQLEGTTRMYQNTTNVTAANNSAVVYGAGGYGYVCNVTASANYTTETASASFTINRNTPTWFNTMTGVLNTNGTSYAVGTNTTINHTISTLVGECVAGSCFNTYWFNDTSSAWESAGISDWNFYNPNTFQYFGWNNTLLAGNYYFMSNNSQTANYSVSETIWYFMIGQVLNIDVRDEATNNDLTFNITIYNSSFSWTDYDITLWSSNATNTPYGEVTIDYWTSTYPQRTYYTSLNNASNQSLVLYLFPTGSTGQYVSFYVKNYLLQPVTTARIYAYDTINATATVVAERATDAAGVATIYLDWTNTYTIVAEDRAGAYNNVSLSIAPTLTGYEIYMGDAPTINHSSNFEDLYYTIYPFGYVLSNNTAQEFQFNLTSVNSTLLYMGFELTYANNTVIYTNNTTTAAGVDILTTLNLSNYPDTTLLGNYWFRKSGYGLFWINKTYIVYPSVNTTYSNLTIQGMADDIALGNLDISEGVFLFMSIIVMMIAGGFGVSFAGEKGGLVGIGVLALFTFLGTNIYSGYFLGWSIFFLTALTLGAWYWIRGVF